MTAYLRMFGCLAVLAGLGLAGPARAEKTVKNAPARLIVEDNAKLFSAAAVEKGKRAIADVRGSEGREVHFETYGKLSDAELKEFNALKADEGKKRDFWKKWAHGKLAGDRGLVILVNWDPGHVHILASETMRKFFTGDKEGELYKRLLDKFGEAKKAKTEAESQKIRDEGFVSAMEYTASNLPKDFGTTGGGHGKTAASDEKPARNPGMGIGGWVCLGISILLGIWLITALVRAFSGGGGGGYGGGGGMGGGGFFPSLLGGLFGAAAGMYMYDHFFGGHSSSATAGDAGAGAGGDAVTDTGNFNEDNYSGGDFGGDAGGGGDFGGGGGDFGGGDF
jgi:hypothetical protein